MSSETTSVSLIGVILILALIGTGIESAIDKYIALEKLKIDASKPKIMNISTDSYEITVTPKRGK